MLITAVGFEDRTLAAARALAEKSCIRALLLMYKPEDHRNRLDEMINLINRKACTLNDDSFIEYDRFNPEAYPSELRTRLGQQACKRVIVDISAMSKLAILLTLDVCRELNVDVEVFYAEAKAYGPTRTDFELARNNKNLHQPTIQVYTGIQGVFRATRLSSVAMQGQPIAAIAFMSFNELLTQALLNAVYPSRLFLVNGRPPKLRWREEATAWIHEQLRQEWNEMDNPLGWTPGISKPVPKRVTSTFAYKETVRTLLELYRHLAVDHRIVLAPTGSKMQTVGCFIAKAIHPDIHIEYPTPNGFLDLYSQGIRGTWVVRFGRLHERIEVLRMIDRKTWLGLPTCTS